MRMLEAKDLFLSLVGSYFSGAEVTFARQSRVAKPDIPLVTLTPGPVKRPKSPVYKVVNGILVAHYESRMSIQVDLFTHGSPVIDDNTGMVVAYSDSAVEDMLAFEDFLNSYYTIEWCDTHDVAVLVDGDVQDLTGLINDNNYEYRSRLSILFYFTQTAIGHAGVLQEASVQYATGEVDAETGLPTYASKEPTATESASGASGKWADVSDGSVVVKPEFVQSSSGGGSKILADEETGFYSEAEIK